MCLLSGYAIEGTCERSESGSKGLLLERLARTLIPHRVRGRRSGIVRMSAYTLVRHYSNRKDGRDGQALPVVPSSVW